MEAELPLSEQVQGFIESVDSRSRRRVARMDKETYEIYRRAVEMIVSEVIDSREALTESKQKEISSSIDDLVQRDPQVVSDLLNEHYTRLVVRAIPGYVSRTLEFSRMDSAHFPSEVTNTYLREATKAYIMGLAQASIALSRAALEQGLKENLGFQDTGHYVRFQELLEEALKYKLWDKVTVRMARAVANAGDAVMHESPSSSASARDVLDTLRGLLQHLYSVKGG